MFAGEAIEEIISYIFYQIVELMNQFTESMSETGVSVFTDPNVRALIQFFKLFAAALWLIGSIMALMEFGIAYQSEATSFRGTGMNLLKSFIALTLFAEVPVQLYNFTVDIQGSISTAITQTAAAATGVPTTMTLVQGFFASALNVFVTSMMPAQVGLIKSVWDFITGAKGSTAALPFQTIIQVVIMLYVVFKVFIGNLKRGGVLLIMIGTGSLHMLSLPRGYSDGFSAWCKQVAALCFTLFMQNIMFTLGLMLSKDSSAIYLTLGILMAAAEVPRIAQMFGLDTSAKANVGGAMQTATSAFTVIKMAAG